jgi:hypothetical protein
MSNEDVKIARLEEKYCSMEKEITEVKDVVVKIKDNHLVHIQLGIDGLKLQQAWMAGVAAAILFAIEYFK